MTQVAERIAELVNGGPGESRLALDHHGPRVGGVVKIGDLVFVVRWTASGATAPVQTAIERVREHAASLDETAIPLVAVPFMGKAGRARCAEAEVAWVDLSGNARIAGPRLHVLVEGKPNRYKRSGRPSTVFAPKSSRITRWMLMNPSRSSTQREIAHATNMDEGYTSRVVGKLENDGLIVRDERGAVRPRDPDLLLDAWGEVYDFSKHLLVRGHIPARSGDALLKQLADTLRYASVTHAATGMAAAWLLDRFASFRIATLFLAAEPSSDLLEELSFREDDGGANVWLAIPNDEGVFHGAAMRDGIRCVHPVQAYLDLHAHPERAKEAARRVRVEHLTWDSDD